MIIEQCSHDDVAEINVELEMALMFIASKKLSTEFEEFKLEYQKAYEQG